MHAAAARACMRRGNDVGMLVQRMRGVRRLWPPVHIQAGASHAPALEGFQKRLHTTQKIDICMQGVSQPSVLSATGEDCHSKDRKSDWPEGKACTSLSMTSPRA